MTDDIVARLRTEAFFDDDLCTEAAGEIERLRGEAVRADTLCAAIQYAVDQNDGLYWLQQWNEGDPGAMRELDGHRTKGVSHD